jgi:hypothetical protein
MALYALPRYYSIQHSGFTACGTTVRLEKRSRRAVTDVKMLKVQFPAFTPSCVHDYTGRGQ